MFSAASIVSRQDQICDLDSIFDEGLRHAEEIEDNIRTKIFEGKLFLNLVKAILSHSLDEKYSQSELDDAKATALRLLYRARYSSFMQSLENCCPCIIPFTKPCRWIRSEISQGIARRSQTDSKLGMVLVLCFYQSKMERLTRIYLNTTANYLGTLKVWIKLG